MGTLVATLVSLALSLGLATLSNKMSKDSYRRDAEEAYKNGRSAPQVLEAITQILQKAATQGQKKLSEVSNQINSLEAGTALMNTGVVRDVVNKLKRELQSKKLDYERRVTENESKSNAIMSAANAYASMSDDYKNSETGKKQYSEIKSKAESLLDDNGRNLLNNYERSIKN